MKPLSVTNLLLVGAAAAVCAACVTVVVVALGAGPILVSPALALSFLLVSALIAWGGVHVKRLRAHRETWMTPLGALRVAMFARASSMAGALFAGGLVGIAGVAFTRLDADAMLATACIASLSACAALVWCVVGAVVERWCVVDPHDDDDAQNGEGRGTRPLSPRA